MKAVVLCINTDWSDITGHAEAAAVALAIHGKTTPIECI